MIYNFKIYFQAIFTNSNNHYGEQGWKIYKNQQEQQLATLHWNGSGGSSIITNCSTIVELKSGDLITVKAHETYLPRIYGAPSHTYLYMYKI